MEEKLKISKGKDGFFEGVVLTSIESLSKDIKTLSDNHEASVKKIYAADDAIRGELKGFNDRFADHLLKDQQAFTQIQSELKSKITYKWFAGTFLLAVVGWTGGVFFFYVSLQDKIRETIDASLESIVTRQDELENKLSEWELLD